MMNVTIELHGVLRLAWGAKEVLLNVPEGSTLADAVELLVQQGGRNVERAIQQPNGTYGVSFFVNGQPRKNDWVLTSGDVITVLMPAAGG